MSEMLGMDLHLKMEIFQATGSFKERGVQNVLLSLTDEQKLAGVVGASLGNHALALSFLGKRLGVPVTVVVPTEGSIMKIRKCRVYGANVIVDGKDMWAAVIIAMQYAKDKGMLYINGYDHPQIIAGHGTLGLEIIDQVQGADAVVVPVGGGGLIAGVATAIKNMSPSTKIIVRN